MANDGGTSARLDESAVADADRLLAQLRQDIGIRTSRDELLRVLVWGVTAPQAAGMHRAYIKHAASREAARDN
jgi:hypothetical protein